MLDKKKNAILNDKEIDNKEIDSQAFQMPDILANLSTGLDIFKVDITKLKDAPDDWNFYSPLSKSKMEELVESIKNIGIMHPLVVWEQSDGQYLILSGHNRKKAYELLLERTNDNKYEKIHCYIKKKNELTIESAKEIIIDTNWVQRQLTPIEKAKSIYEKYTGIVKNKPVYKTKDEDGHTRDKIAEEYNISGRQVSNYYRLNFLIDEIKEMIVNNEMSIRTGVKIAMFHPLTQKFLFDNYKDFLNSKIVKDLDPQLEEEEIKTIMDKNLTSEEDINLKYTFVISEKDKVSFEKELESLLLKYKVKKQVN